MRIGLESPFSKRLLLGAAVVLASAYGILAAFQCIAYFLADHAARRTLRLAVRMDPGNADYRNRLGHYYDFVARDPSAALHWYQSAARLNPHNAKYWLDVANTYQVMGDQAAQTSAVEQAVLMDPTMPEVAWQAANLYLVQGETEKALHQFHVVLQSGDPSYIAMVMQMCWRVSPNVDVLLRDVLPGTTDSYLFFLSQLMSKGQIEDTVKVWDALISLHQPFAIQRVFDYIQYLLTHKEVDQASLVWKQAMSLLSLGAYLASSHNLIVNPDFSLNVLNGGFDWRYRTETAVSLTLDSSNFHSGHRSLSIVFDGPGVEDAGIYQLIPVLPSTTYEFSGYYKNDEIEGAGGLYLVLQDAYTRTTYFQSEELREGEFWKIVTGELKTGPDTKLLILRVQRLPSGRPIRGKLWIDDFRLAEKQPPGGEP